MRRVLRNPWQRHNSIINFASVQDVPFFNILSCKSHWIITLAKNRCTQSSDEFYDTNWNRSSRDCTSGLGISVSRCKCCQVSKRKAQQVEWRHFRWCALLLTDGVEKMNQILFLFVFIHWLHGVFINNFHMCLLWTHTVWAGYMFSMFAMWAGYMFSMFAVFPASVCSPQVLHVRRGWLINFSLFHILAQLILSDLSRSNCNDSVYMFDTFSKPHQKNVACFITHFLFKWATSVDAPTVDAMVCKPLVVFERKNCFVCAFKFKRKNCTESYSPLVRRTCSV